MQKSDRNYTILLMIATLLSQVEHWETTRPINKVRKQVRIGLKKLQRELGDNGYHKLVHEANNIWESGKAHVRDKEGFTVSLSLSLVILYDLLNEPYKSKWFSERNFNKAINSLEEGYELSTETEKSSSWLINHFREELGITQRKLQLGVQNES